MIRDLIYSFRDSLTGVSGDLPLGTLIIVAVVIAAILGVAAVVLLVFPTLSKSSSVSRRLAERAVVRTASGGTGAGTWIWRLALVAVIVGTLVTADAYLGRDSTCLQCHKGNREAAALKNTVHADIECVGCHQPAGPTGGARQAVAYSRMLFLFAQARAVPKTEGRRLIENGACLRCHHTVARGTSSANGIRVRHWDFLKKGAMCTDCHGVTAHPEAISTATEPTMDKCTTCHDGTLASRKCELCHEADVAANSDIASFGKVDIAGDSESCYRCHPERQCTPCHGARMPHPENWMAAPEGSGIPGHARDGFARREVCFRCHFAPGQPFVGSNEGCSCHGLLGRMHGGEPWVEEHGLQATGRKPGQAARCFDCHGEGICLGCHPATYRLLYNPVMGEDDYVRDIPADPFMLDF